MAKNKQTESTEPQTKEFLFKIPSDLIQQLSEGIDMLLSKLTQEMSAVEKGLTIRRNIQNIFKLLEDKYSKTTKDGITSVNTGVLLSSLLTKDLRAAYYYQFLENIRSDEDRLLTLGELAEASTARLMNRRSASNTDAQKEALLSIENELLSILNPES